MFLISFNHLLDFLFILCVFKNWCYVSKTLTDKVNQIKNYFYLYGAITWSEINKVYIKTQKHKTIKMLKQLKCQEAKY